MNAPASDKPFHWHGTMAEFDAEVRRRWIESSEELGLDHGMPNAAAALAAQEPKPSPGADAGRDRYYEALQRIVDAVAAGDAAAVDKLARNALGLTRVGRPGPFQPAPDLEAAFANGMRVRTGLCTVEAHDREHFQVRTNGHWLCGHLLASVLAAQGIVAGTEAQPAPELAVLLADWRKTADSLKERRGVADARERNTLEVVIGQVEAIAAQTSSPPPALAADGAPADVRPRADGRRSLDITCGKCGEDYGTNVTDADEIECPECEARRCPHCLAWYGGNS